MRPFREVSQLFEGVGSQHEFFVLGFDSVKLVILDFWGGGNKEKTCCHVAIRQPGLIG